MQFRTADEEEAYLQQLRDSGMKVNYQRDDKAQKDFNRLYRRCKTRRQRLGLIPLFGPCRERIQSFDIVPVESLAKSTRKQAMVEETPVEIILEIISDDEPEPEPEYEQGYGQWYNPRFYRNYERIQERDYDSEYDKNWASSSCTGSESEDVEIEVSEEIIKQHERLKHLIPIQPQKKLLFERHPKKYMNTKKRNPKKNPKKRNPKKKNPKKNPKKRNPKKKNPKKTNPRKNSKRNPKYMNKRLDRESVILPN